MDEALKRFNDTAYDIGKLLISLSSGILVISVSLQKVYLSNALSYEYVLFAGWVLELLSIIFGTLFLFLMLRFYDILERVRTYYWPAIVFGALQYLSFLLGLVALVIFTAYNLK